MAKKDHIIENCFCKRCGSANVEIRAFINQKTGFVDYSAIEEPDTWCEDCEDHMGVVFKDKNGEIIGGTE